MIECVTKGLPKGHWWSCNDQTNLAVITLSITYSESTLPPLSVNAIEWQWQQRRRRRSWCHRRHGGVKRKPQKSSKTTTIDDSLVEVTTRSLFCGFSFCFLMICVPVSKIWGLAVSNTLCLLQKTALFSVHNRETT